MTRRSPGADDALHVVLLAGGRGTRFWPWSREAKPKQFLPLAGSESLLRATWRRARRLVPAGRIWVVAPRRLARAVRHELPDLPARRLVLEPSPRDTCPAIALACAAVERERPGATVAILPTDHVIPDGRAFVAAVRVASRAAAAGSLVCLGVPPDRPATGFGYLRCGARPAPGRAIPVQRFVEKPNAVRARRFVASGRYLWNGGMFVWRAATFLDALEAHAPATARAVAEHLAGRRGAWERAEAKSVDYAVMEKARGVKVVPLVAGWDDVGSWEAAARLRGPAGDRRAVLVDSPGSLVFSSGRVVALVGIGDAIVVETSDAVLVASRDRAEEVKRVVAELKRRGDDRVL